MPNTKSSLLILTHASAAAKSGSAFAKAKGVTLLVVRWMHWLVHMF